MGKTLRLQIIFASLLILLFLSAADNLATVAILQAPAGAVADATPTYKWTIVAAATQYQYQLL